MLYLYVRRQLSEEFTPCWAPTNIINDIPLYITSSSNEGVITMETADEVVIDDSYGKDKQYNYCK